jgi:twinkle protein
VKTFTDFGIELEGKMGIEVQVPCPQCSPNRKKPKARCLSVNTEKGVWCCHHCDWTGSLRTGPDQPSQRPRVIIKPSYAPPPELDCQLLDWFAARGISGDVLRREGVGLITAYMPHEEADVPCIAFPYRKNGEVVNVKYRALASKGFRQVAGAEKILYRQDQIAADSVVIVEGEVDALSVVMAGVESVVSVPDGAPPANAKNYTSKFTFLDQEPDPLKGMKRLVLAMDSDEPGRALEVEMARRLGRDRCWRVRWPEGCKDANDVLRAYGPEEVRARIRAAEPWPIEDVVYVKDVADEVVNLYLKGPPKGLSTGWQPVNEFYTIEPGQLTIVTGVPSHGKSEWLDALAVNLATLHGWRFAVCSPENYPLPNHLGKFAEKWTGAPFRRGPSQRMSHRELGGAIEWLNDHFAFILPNDQLTIPGILDRATSLVQRWGIQGLILDPFNEFDHTRAKEVKETDYISDMLGLLKRWARRWAAHVWLVAHPQKLYRRDDGTYPVPTPYDISGSAHWRNKADNCLTVWRDLEHEASPVQIHVQKVRFRHIGKPGLAELQWNSINGRYEQLAPKSVTHWQDRDHETGT